jgi:hypothetical protein
MRALELIACLWVGSCTFVSTVNEPALQSEIVAQGEWTHPSGAVFPEQIAGFRRGPITALSADGRSVAIAYLIPEGPPVFVTVYVYPRKNQALRDHFESVVKEIQQYHRDAEVQSAELDKFPGRTRSAPQVGARFVFETSIGGNNEKVAAYALLGGTDEWWVKVRATFPLEIEQPALRPLAAFLAKLPEPGPAAPAAPPTPEAQGSR